jgi:Ligand-gated ion channel
VIPVMGLLFVVHEWNKKGSLYPKSSYMVIRHKDSHMEEIEERKVPFYRHMIRSIYMSFVSVLQGGYGNPLMTQGARIHLIGFSFFILTLLAVYTANLAAILQFQLIVPQVISLESAIRQNYKICALREVAAITMQNYPKIQPTSFIFDPVDGKPGFYTSIDRQSLVMDSINDDESKREAAANIPHSLRKYCRAALAFDQDLQLEQGSGRHCDKVFVGESVGTLDVGIPLFEDVAKELSYLLVSLKNDGFLQLAISNHTPTDRCAIKAELSILTSGEGGKSLTIAELSGIWIVSFGFAISGLLITFFSYVTSKRKKSSVRSLYRMNQHGERMNRLERDDEWIRQEGIRVHVDQHGHLKWSKQADPSTVRSQVRSTLAERRAKKQLQFEKMQLEYFIPPEAFRSYDLPDDYLDDSTRSTEISESTSEYGATRRKKKKSKSRESWEKL